MKKLKLNSSYRLVNYIETTNNIQGKESSFLNMFWRYCKENTNSENDYKIYIYINNECKTIRLLIKNYIFDFLQCVGTIYDIDIEKLINNDIFTIEEI